MTRARACFILWNFKFPNSIQIILKSKTKCLPDFINWPSSDTETFLSPQVHSLACLRAATGLSFTKPNFCLMISYYIWSIFLSNRYVLIICRIYKNTKWIICLNSTIGSVLPKSAAPATLAVVVSIILPLACLAYSTHRKSTTKQTFFFKWQMSHTSSSFCKLMMDLCVNMKIPAVPFVNALSAQKMQTMQNSASAMKSWGNKVGQSNGKVPKLKRRTN